MESAAAGVEAIGMYFRLVPETLIVKANQMGCLYVNSAAEFGGRDGLRDQQFSGFYQRLRDAFKNALENEFARGWRPKQDIAMAAPLLVSISYGMTIIAKSGVTAVELDQAAETAVQLLI